MRKAHKLTICTARSCSAGSLAQEFSKTEGASQHFMGGVVSYTKEAKCRVLASLTSLSRRETAVCSSVAEAMARGAVARLRRRWRVYNRCSRTRNRMRRAIRLVWSIAAWHWPEQGGTSSKRLNSKSSKPEGIIEEACIEAMRLLRSFTFS